MVEGLTDYALIGFMSVDSALRLELGLDHIQRAGRDAGDEAASRASYAELRSFAYGRGGERS